MIDWQAGRQADGAGGAGGAGGGASVCRTPPAWQPESAVGLAGFVVLYRAPDLLFHGHHVTDSCGPVQPFCQPAVPEKRADLGHIAADSTVEPVVFRLDSGSADRVTDKFSSAGFV